MGNLDDVEKTTIGEFAFLILAQSGSEFFKTDTFPSPDMTKKIKQ